jgi:hypothetical protein
MMKLFLLVKEKSIKIKLKKNFLDLCRLYF